ncbi:MAG: hypothetical protein WHW07_08165 [Bacteroidales bacterium]|jgi:hypothetical protein|nr:hypothetical protein [Bacteroidales bacterium]HRT00087.1 hypothetical protein [Bacteroidales bacterium]
MKKNFFNAVILLIVLGTSVISCTKDETQVQTQVSSTSVISLKSTMIFEPEFLVNKDNPYDVYGLKMYAFYADISILFQDSIYSDYLLFERAYKELLIKHSNNLYPSIDTASYSEYESKIISNLTTNLFIKNIKEITQKCESDIIADRNLTNAQKQRLLAIVSLYKFSYYYQSEIMLMYATWEERHHDCMVRELNTIFADDGNPLPEMFFIAGCPETVIQLNLVCAWEATFGID